MYPGLSNKKCLNNRRNMSNGPPKTRLQGRDVTIVKYGRNAHCTRLVTGMGKEINYVSLRHLASYLNIQIASKAVQEMPAARFGAVLLEIVNHRDTPLALRATVLGTGAARLLFSIVSRGARDSLYPCAGIFPRDTFRPHSRRAPVVALSPAETRAGRTTISFGFGRGEFAPSVN